jgi:hypothetical protein
VRRTANRAIDKQPICNGNTETWRQTFGPESIIAWHFRSFRSKRERIMAWSRRPDGPRVLRFTSARALERWLTRLEAEDRLASR